MAVLGVGGRLVLKRTPADPCALSLCSLDAASNSLETICPDYWSGDRVNVINLPLPGNVPNFCPDAEDPLDEIEYLNGDWDCVPGGGEYSNGNILDSNTGYSPCDDYPPGEIPPAGTLEYDNADITGQPPIPCIPNTPFLDDFYIHIDELGRVSFYNTRCDALAGCKEKRVELVEPLVDTEDFPEYRNAYWCCAEDNGEYRNSDIQNIKGGESICKNSPLVDIPNPNHTEYDNADVTGALLIIAPYKTLPYTNSGWACVEIDEELYGVSDVEDVATGTSICNYPPDYLFPVADDEEYNNADIQPRDAEGDIEAAHPWQILCEIREWSLELDAPSVDTTAVSEKFGTAVKSLVTGGGSTEFFVDRQCYTDYQDNGLMLMQLLLMTTKTAVASAQFWIMSNDNACDASCGKIDGALYYETDILITQTAVNLRPTEMVAGTANFVTTGEIRLLMDGKLGG